MAAGGAGGGRGGGEEEDRRHGGVDEDDDIGGRMHARIQPGRFGFGGACPAAAWSGRPLRGFGVTASRQRGPWPARYQDRAVEDPGGAGTSPDWSLLAEVRYLALPAWSCPPPTQIQRARLGKSARQPPRLRTGGRFGRGVVIHGWHGWLSPSKPSPALVAQPSRSKLRYRVPEVRGSRFEVRGGIPAPAADPAREPKQIQAVRPGQGAFAAQGKDHGDANISA